MIKLPTREDFERLVKINTERNEWNHEYYNHLPARQQWDAWQAAIAEVQRLNATTQPVSDGWVICGEIIDKPIPTPSSLCYFVAKNYSQYQGAWLCGKCCEILGFLLGMAGYEYRRECEVRGDVHHVYIICGNLRLDPTAKQFGEVAEVQLIAQ